MITAYEASNVSADGSNYEVDFSFDYDNHFTLTLWSKTLVDENVYTVCIKNKWAEICSKQSELLGFRKIHPSIVKTHQNCEIKMGVCEYEKSALVVISAEISANDFNTLLEALGSAREVFWDLGLAGEPIFEVKENIKTVWKEKYYREYIEKLAWKLVQSNTVS